MKINEYKKLEEKINGYNFNQSYKNIKYIMTILSYFGNIASIFLAYFFMSKVIAGAMTDSPIAVFIASVIILTGIELLKRDIFDKFSIQYLKEKALNKSVLPLFLVSLFIISASFYASINGAKEFSSKSKELDQNKTEIIVEYRDSLNTIYSGKIKNIELEIKDTKSKLDIKDKEQTQIESSPTISRQQRQRISDLKNERTILRDDINKFEANIDTLNSQLNRQVESKEVELHNDVSIKKNENSSNSFIFVMLSTILELVILTGVFFSQYYKFRSYREFRNKIEKDPNYQKWLVYDQILSIIVTDETKMNQRLPSNKAIIEMCKVNDLIILPKDVTDFLKVINGLGIIKSSGSAKYINKQRDISQELLKKHFNIE